MIPLSLEMDAALDEASLRIAVLVEIDHPAGMVRAWSGVGSLDWNGNTFKGAGALGRIEGIGETAEIRTTETRYSLISPALDADAAAIVVQSPRGRLVRTWLALLDDDWQIIPDPVQIDESIVENIETKTGADGMQVLELPATSAMFSFRRPRLAALTPEAQKARFPGDTGFDLIATEVADAEILWGPT